MQHVAPHAYHPSIMHQGDCSVCGNLQDHPNHAEPADLAEQLALDGFELDPAEVTPVAPADEFETIARGHQEALAGYMQRKLDAQRAGRLAVEKLEAERRELAATYVSSLRRIETSIEGIRARTAEEVATVDRLTTYSRAALEALGS